MQNHVHPLNADEIMCGTILIPGTKLQEEDVYDSTTGKWGKCPSALVGSQVNGRSSATWIRPATVQACVYCEDKKRIPTDLWAKTGALWQPCSLCCLEAYEKFWALSDDQDRINWFSNKAKVG